MHPLHREEVAGSMETKPLAERAARAAGPRPAIYVDAQSRFPTRRVMAVRPILLDFDAVDPCAYPYRPTSNICQTPAFDGKNGGVWTGAVILELMFHFERRSGFLSTFDLGDLCPATETEN